jgi:hypothetical protein
LSSRGASATGGAHNAAAMAKRATVARSSGGGGLAFGRRKEKRERASTGLKGGGVGLGWPAVQGPGRGRPPKRRGGETGRERVATQMEGRRERASLDGKVARCLLG